MGIVQIYNPGSVGIVKDIAPDLLPPEAWTDGANMRMQDTVVKRWPEPAQVFGTPSVAPGFVFSVPSSGDFYWLYANLTAVYVYDGVSHTDITRGAGPYSATEYRNWNGCILGGVPILNNAEDVPQYWPTLSPAVDLVALANWPSNLRAKIIRNFGSFLVALNLVEGGTALPHALRWSHPADPGTVPSSWDPLDPAVDTGQTHLTDIQGGEIVDALILGNYLVIYKERSTHLMRFVGGNHIMGFEFLFNQGLRNVRAVASIDAGTKHFCVGEDDVYVHQGTKQLEYPLDQKDRRYLYADIDPEFGVNSFAFDNPEAEEACFAYPSEGSEFPNKMLVWNYRTNIVSFRPFVGTSVDSGVLPTSAGVTWDGDSGSWDSDVVPWNPPSLRKIVAGDPEGLKLWALDYELSGTDSLSFLQRTGLAVIGKDRMGQWKADFQNLKFFGRIWPKISGDAVVEVRMGVQDEIDGAVTWANYQTYSRAQKFLDFEITGRFGAVEFRALTARAWELRGYDVDVTVVSEY